MKVGIPTEDEIEELARAILVKWRVLGRKLHLKEPLLEEINGIYTEQWEKGYNMLIYWKYVGSSFATYEHLDYALRHPHVGRQDLAEKFCSDWVSYNIVVLL